jgi:hypothetical protein
MGLNVRERGCHAHSRSFVDLEELLHSRWEFQGLLLDQGHQEEGGKNLGNRDVVKVLFHFLCTEDRRIVCSRYRKDWQIFAHEFFVTTVHKSVLSQNCLPFKRGVRAGLWWTASSRRRRCCTCWHIRHQCVANHPFRYQDWLLDLDPTRGRDRLLPKIDIFLGIFLEK